MKGGISTESKSGHKCRQKLTGSCNVETQRGQKSREKEMKLKPGLFPFPRLTLGPVALPWDHSRKVQSTVHSQSKSDYSEKWIFRICIQSENP